MSGKLFEYQNFIFLLQHVFHRFDFEDLSFSIVWCAGQVHGQPLDGECEFALPRGDERRLEPRNWRAQKMWQTVATLSRFTRNTVEILSPGMLSCELYWNVYQYFFPQPYYLSDTFAGRLRWLINNLNIRCCDTEGAYLKPRSFQNWDRQETFLIFMRKYLKKFLREDITTLLVIGKTTTR